MSEALVLGVDGGGTKTTVWLAAARPTSGDEPVEATARGDSGPANVEMLDLDRALAAVDDAISAAFESRGETRAPVAAACLALAGAGEAATRDKVRQWALDRRIAEQTVVVHDAVPVLACADPAANALALLSGTGSFAFGRNEAGRSVRAGGYGPFLGDEGSAYAIGRAALREVLRSADGRAPRTELTDSILGALDLDRPRALVRWCGHGQSVAAIAQLAELVDQAAERGDDVAESILEDAGAELGAMARAVAHALGFGKGEYALCLAGSTLLRSATLERATLQALEELGPLPLRVLRVHEPVQGCVRIARRALTGDFHRADEER